MNRWTRVLLAAVLLTTSLIAASACSLRYDFTECEVNLDCSELETTRQSDPADNVLYQCVNQECVVVGGEECRGASDCLDPEADCENGQCIVPMDNMDADSGDAQDTGDADNDTEEVIENSCENTTDCVEDPNFGDGYACANDSTCQQVSCTEESYCTDTFGESFTCGGDDECIDTACDTTTACIDNFGQSFYCAPSGTCMDTAADGCEGIFYPSGVDKDEVVILGTIIPTEVQGFTSVGPTIRNATRMAVIEYGNNAFDLPGGPAVAHLQCEGGTTANAMAAAEHMRDIEVPVIVGPLTSSNYIDVVQNVTGDASDNPVVTISMSATSPTIGALNAAGTYSFQLIANDRFQSSALADRAQVLNTRSCTEVQQDECTDTTECQATFGADWVFDGSNASKPCTDPDPKVNIFYKNDRYGNDLRSLTVTRFQDRYAEADVSVYQYPDPAALNFDPDTISSEFATVIGDAVSTSPDADINIFIGTGEAVQFAFSYIGAVSSQTAVDTTTRQYVFSHGAAADSPNIMQRFGTPEDYLPRVEAVAPNIFNTTDDLFSDWQSRYAITFQEPAATTVGGLAYDSAFTAIFAMAAASLDRDDNLASVPVTPERVSKVFQEGWLQDGGATQVQLKEVTTFPGAAKQQLGRGNNIDMVGVSGALDFTFENNVNLGTIRSNYLGLAVNSRQDPGGTIYEGVPARIYLLQPGEVFGTWSSF